MDRTFISTFYCPHKVTKTKIKLSLYRNPIFWQTMKFWGSSLTTPHSTKRLYNRWKFVMLIVAKCHVARWQYFMRVVQIFTPNKNNIIITIKQQQVRLRTLNIKTKNNRRPLGFISFKYFYNMLCMDFRLAEYCKGINWRTRILNWNDFLP